MAMVRNRIVREYLVLCEGKDVENFLISYLNSDALLDDPRFRNDIQTFDFGGVGQLTSFIKNLTNMDGFESVRSLLVLRDAETSVTKAESEIGAAFTEAGLPVPQYCCRWNSAGFPSVAYVLFPSCDETPTTGTLEDLCWQVLAGDDSSEVSAEASRFIEKVKASHPMRIVSHGHKSRIHAYLSASDRFVSLKIGEAAKAGAFDWANEKLLPLRTVLAGGF